MRPPSGTFFNRVIVDVPFRLGVRVLNDARLPMRKFISPEIIFGSGSIELVGQHASNLSPRRVLVVSDAGVREAGWTGSVEASLRNSGLDLSTYDRASANPCVEDVVRGARRYLDDACDLVVAVGGGSPIDCAKAIGIMAASGMDVRWFEGMDRVRVPGPPLICVPTTAGSSADVSPFAVITDREGRKKMTIINRLLVPDLTVIDPATTVTMDADLTAHTGMDALAHAFESYVSNASSPLTDLFALEAVKLIAENLPSARQDPKDMGAREQMMLASTYAGLAFSNAGLGLLHAMAHSIGGFYDAMYQQAACALLEHVIEFNHPCAEERYLRLEMAMFGSARGKGPLIDLLGELRRDLGADGGLESIGVKRGDIYRLSENAVHDPCLATNPRPAGRKEVEELYERAM